MSQYFVEYAKTGRAKCKKCKQPIEKGSIKFVTEGSSSNGEYNISSSTHPACFVVPRKIKVDAQEFFESHCTDRSEDSSILPDKIDELKVLLESKPKSSKKDEGGPSPLDAIKKAFEAKASDDEESSPKKAKTDLSTQVAIYSEIHKLKVNDLKDILNWNRQIKTGTRDVLLFKVIDGKTYGRLGFCGICSGKLKIAEDRVICGGRFDEDTNRRIPCDFTCSPADAPRLQPWFAQEPTEEEAQAMNDEEEKARDGNGNGDDDEQAVGDMQVLKTAASSLPWALNSRAGLKEAAKKLLELLQSHKVEVPGLQDVGKFITANKTKSADYVAEEIAKKYGFKGANEAKKEEKQKSIAMTVKNPANAKLVAAFRELADLYFKTGNANAGATYSKVTGILSDFEDEITESNAKGLGKGKTKVPGIGKSSADKIHEFCSTGKIAKLEEKRADAA